MVRQDADGIRFKWPAGVDRTINLPQAFDMFDKELAGAISKHNREKRISRLQYLDADIATLPDYGMRGRPRAQNRPDAACQIAAPRRAILHTLRD
jgi:hypothetical protein